MENTAIRHQADELSTMRERNHAAIMAPLPISDMPQPCDIMIDVSSGAEYVMAQARCM